jgi:hypothetical protein
LEVALKELAENSFRQKKGQISDCRIIIKVATLVFGEFFKLTSPEEAEN